MKRVVDRRGAISANRHTGPPDRRSCHEPSASRSLRPTRLPVVVGRESLLEQSSDSIIRMPLKALRKVLRFAVADEGSVKTRVMRSGIWVASAEATIAILNIGRSIVLARLLSPEVFGLMGLVSIVVRTVETFTRPGIGQAVIQRRDSFEIARDTAFTLLLVRGLMLALLLAGLAPLVAWFYEADELGPMLQVMSFVFLIGGLQNINLIAKQKDLDFRSISHLDQVTAVFGTITTVVMAYWLRNVWALVIGQLATSGLYTLLSYYFVPGRPRITVNWRIARELLSYGKFITASSIVLFIATELDVAVLGKVVGPEQLGYYVLAFTIANLVTTNISKVVSRIMLPAYSALQTDMPALKRAYIRTLSSVLLLVLPAAVGTIMVAHPLIRAVYGETWEQAIVPLQVLALFGLVRALASFNGYLFEGIGQPNIAFRLALFRLSVIAPMIVPMIKSYALLGAAITVTAGIAVQWMAGLIYLSRFAGITWRDFARILSGPLWKSGVMAGILYGMTVGMDLANLPGLALLAGTGILSYGLLNVGELRRFRRQGSS